MFIGAGKVYSFCVIKVPMATTFSARHNWGWNSSSQPIRKPAATNDSPIMASNGQEVHRQWTSKDQYWMNYTSKELNPVFWKPIKVSLNPWPFQASVVCTNGTFMTREAMFYMFKLSEAVSMCREKRFGVQKWCLYTKRIQLCAPS